MWVVEGVGATAAAAGGGPSLSSPCGYVIAPFGGLGRSVASCCRRAPTPVASGCSAVDVVGLPRGLYLCHGAFLPASLGSPPCGTLPLVDVGWELIAAAVGVGAAAVGITAADAVGVRPTGVGACRAFMADPLIGGARHEGAIRPMPSRPRATVAHVPLPLGGDGRVHGDGRVYVRMRGSGHR
jgi:hypothetical protein